MTDSSDRWRQLTLALFRDPGASFENFHAGNNREAVSAVCEWSEEAGPWCVLLWGANGVGKTHLLQAAVRATAARGRQAMYVPLLEALSYGAGALDGLDELHCLAIDDIAAAAGVRAWEEALFALYNRMQASGRRLLLSADAAPRDVPLALPDLRSRLAAALIYHLKPLGDDEKCAALIAAAAARGMSMPEAVAVYLLRRLPRSWAALSEALKLDD